MESELLRIKCPNCGAVLTIKDSRPGNQEYSMPSMQKGIKVHWLQSSQTTIYSTEWKWWHHHGRWNPHWPFKNQSIGKLQKIGTSHMYTLSLGINTIGRKAQTSNATVQIDTDDLTMSRSHSIIEVRKLKTGGYIHYFSNAQNKMPLISILD